MNPLIPLTMEELEYAKTAYHNFPYTETETYKVTDWQREDLDREYDRGATSADWSEMGCYKTSSALWLIQRKMADIESPKVLVVTTKSGKGTYLQLAPEILPDWSLYNTTSNDFYVVIDDREFKIPAEPNGNSNGAKPKPAVVMTHYHTFNKKSKMLPRLLATDWDMVVLDEAHRIKDYKGNWKSQIRKLKCDHKHIMTGTGFINRPDEIWSLFNWLEPDIYSSYWRFRTKFCREAYDDRGYNRIVGLNHWTEDEFKKRVRDFGPRRTKREVFKNLKDPIRTIVPIELNPTQRKMYNDIVTTLQTLDHMGEPIYSPNVLSMLQRLRQICVATPYVKDDYYSEKLERRVIEVGLKEPSSKLDALMEIIDGLEWDDERKDQIVVFSCFKDPIELAKKRFERKNISYIHLETKDNDRQRYEKWAIEFPKKNHQVFISTLQLGSESISLTSATTCVFLDRSWSPKDNEQGVSRVWRPGQVEAAQIINIDAINTVDKRIFKVNQEKMSWFNAIFGDGGEESTDTD